MAETFDTLVSQVRRIADIEDDGNHISDAEIKEDFNNSLRALWSTIVNASNGSLVSKVSPKLVRLGDNSYQLPADLLRLLSVDVRRSSTWQHSVEGDVQSYAQLTQKAYKGLRFSQHFLQWNLKQGWYELFLFPGEDPDNIFVRYIPAAPQLALGTDELKLPADWGRWAVYDTAIKCNIKEETDPTFLILERDKIEQRVIEDVRAASPAQVKTIRDISYQEENSRFYLPSINQAGS